MGITPYQLCKDTGLKQTQVSEIIRGKRAITDETDAVLCKYLDLSQGFWRRMQVSYDARKKARELAALAASVTPYSELHPKTNGAPELAHC